MTTVPIQPSPAVSRRAFLMAFGGSLAAACAHMTDEWLEQPARLRLGVEPTAWHGQVLRYRFEITIERGVEVTRFGDLWARYEPGLKTSRLWIRCLHSGADPFILPGSTVWFDESVDEGRKLRGEFFVHDIVVFANEIEMNLIAAGPVEFVPAAAPFVSIEEDATLRGMALTGGIVDGHS